MAPRALRKNFTGSWSSRLLHPLQKKLRLRFEDGGAARSGRTGVSEAVTKSGAVWPPGLYGFTTSLISMKKIYSHSVWSWTKMQICQTAGVLAVAALICWIGLGAPAQAAPPPSATVIDSCQYAGDAAAQAAWVPMKGSAPVAPVMLAGKLALRLPCNFTGNPVDRASWDKSVKLDLLACQGVEFKFLCRDAAAVAHFNIYFQSGDGWYHTSFFPESLTNWNTVVIDKSSVKIEGKPAGWGQIKTIRISAWRSNTANTEFYLSDLRKSGELGAGTSVVVLRSETAAQRWPGQISSFQQSIANVTQGLKSFGVNSLVVSDGELTPGQLALTKLLVLPQAPVLSDRTTAAQELCPQRRKTAGLLYDSGRIARGFWN